MNLKPKINIKPHTPSENDKDVIRLLDHIDAPYDPLKIAIKAKRGAELSDCTNIVEAHVKKHGGKVVYGWQIWKSSILVEAEFHAVWENQKGELVDLTPKPPGFTHILFAEDDRIVYDGKQIDNVRLNITDNLLVDHFIEASKAFYRLQNNGEKALLHGKDYEDSLSEEEVNRLQSCFQLKQLLHTMIQVGATVDSVCLCGEPKAYKDCHGKDFNKFIYMLSPN